MVSHCANLKSMLESTHPLAKSFGYAFDGLLVALKKGRNFKIQIFLGFLSALAGFFFRITNFEWLILSIIISLVLILELVNTSIESIVDLVSPEIRDKAKVAKDVSAAAVLIASISSIVIAGIIFLPKIAF